jgi:hypothetical protein
MDRHSENGQHLIFIERRTLVSNPASQCFQVGYPRDLILGRNWLTTAIRFATSLSPHEQN